MVTYRTTVKLFGRWPIFPAQKTTVTFEGPSVVHFQIFTPFGEGRLLKTQLPTRPFHVYTEDRWYASRWVPMPLLRVLAWIGKGALEQDRIVWENRLYTDRPRLVKGDGPFGKHRKWFAQFYSENSKGAFVFARLFPLSCGCLNAARLQAGR